MALLAVTDVIGDVIDAIGAPGLIVLLVGETFFPPMPSEAILPLAGFYVDRGDLSYPGAVLGATTGSLIGALVLYWLGRYGGRPLVLRERRVLRVRERHLELAERWFDHYGPVIVLVARVIPLARSYISVPAGTMRMNVLTFSILTFIGSAVWNAALIGAGWALGSRWEEVADVVGTVGPIMVIVLGVVLVALGVRWWRRRGAEAQHARP